MCSSVHKHGKEGQITCQWHEVNGVWQPEFFYFFLVLFCFVIVVCLWFWAQSLQIACTLLHYCGGLLPPGSQSATQPLSQSSVRKGNNWLSRKIPSWPLPSAGICFLCAAQFRSFFGVHRQWMGNRSCCWASQLGAVCSDAFVFAWPWLHPVCSREKESLLVTKPRALDQPLLCRESKEGHLVLSSFPPLSLRWWEEPPDRMRRGLLSLSLHCTKEEPFAHLHRWFKKLKLWVSKGIFSPIEESEAASGAFPVSKIRNSQACKALEDNHFLPLAL